MATDRGLRYFLWSKTSLGKPTEYHGAVVRSRRLAKDGRPHDAKFLATLLNKKERNIANWLNELTQIEAMCRDCDGVLFDPRMVEDFAATSYEVSRKKNRESIGNPDNLPNISQTHKIREEETREDKDAAVTAEGDRNSIISSIVSRFEKLNENDFLEALRHLPEFEGVNISKEKKNHDRFRRDRNLTTGTRKTLVSWLLNCDKPLSDAKSSGSTKTAESLPPDEKPIFCRAVGRTAKANRQS